jgi:hypothetical protein
MGESSGRSWVYSVSGEIGYRRMGIGHLQLVAGNPERVAAGWRRVLHAKEAEVGGTFLEQTVAVPFSAQVLGLASAVRPVLHRGIQFLHRL